MHASLWLLRRGCRLKGGESEEESRKSEFKDEERGGGEMMLVR